MAEYDDLDDVLDEFDEQDRILGPASKADPASAAPATAPTTSASTTATGSADASAASAATDTAATSTASEKDPKVKATDLSSNEKSIGELDEQFASQLKLGMDELTNELAGDPEAQKAFEQLMAGIANERPGQAPAATSAAPRSFEDTISQTMNRLNENQQQDTNEDEFLEKMLRELQSAAGVDGGAGGGMDGLLAGLMEELSSKDILYEPLKEMHDKYPSWLEQHGPSLDAAELKRYKEQQAIVKAIISKFEEPSYSDDNKEARKFISAKMEEMQNSGAPPAELVGDLAEGALPGGIPGIPGLANDGDGCGVQ